MKATNLSNSLQPVVDWPIGKFPGEPQSDCLEITEKSKNFKVLHRCWEDLNKASLMLEFLFSVDNGYPQFFVLELSASF